MNLTRIFIAALLLPLTALAAEPAGWNDPFPAHRIADNFYFVGTAELASFLIVTKQGLILMNSDYEASMPVIQANVKALGFDFKNIKILISGHAHPDHIEADQMVKDLTGAQVVVGRLEVPDVKAFKNPKGKAQPIDRIVDDGDTVTLGEVTLTAHVMPGHTKGCLAWTLPLTDNGKKYNGFVECSLNGQFLKYVDNKDYPNIEADMRATYKKALQVPAEIWVSSHGSFYDLKDKYAKLKNAKPGDPNPFLDPEGYKAHVKQFEKTFEDAVAKQKAADKPPAK
jgi:metallo-beta-lactamase class B